VPDKNNLLPHERVRHSLTYGGEISSTKGTKITKTSDSRPFVSFVDNMCRSDCA